MYDVLLACPDDNTLSFLTVSNRPLGRAIERDMRIVQRRMRNASPGLGCSMFAEGLALYARFVEDSASTHGPQARIFSCREQCPLLTRLEATKTC